MTVRTQIAWGIIVAAVAVYLVMLLVTLPHLSALAGGVPVFDLRPTGYELQDAQGILAALGDAGRRYYLNIQQPLDTMFPLLNAATVAIALAAAFPDGNWRYFRLKKAHHAALLAIICLPVAALDLLENILVRDLLTADVSAISAEKVKIASTVTIAKSVAVTVAYCLSLVAVFCLVMDKIRGRRRGLAGGLR